MMLLLLFYFLVAGAHSRRKLPEWCISVCANSLAIQKLLYRVLPKA